MNRNTGLGLIVVRLSVVVLVLNLAYLILQLHLTSDAMSAKSLSNSCQRAQEESKLFSFDDLTEIKHGDVLKIQNIWKKELSNVILQRNNRCVTDQTIETGGKPERILVITTWRSGSTYIGAVIRGRPGTYYFFEPLHNTYINVAREESEVRDAQEILRNLFYCRNPDGRHTTQYLPYDSFFSRNQGLVDIAGPNKLQWDPTFTNVMCRKSPSLAMKVVGLRLRHAIPLVADEKLNLKVIYLVRDPQATINSRLKEDWCGDLSSCSNFSIFCSDLEDDFKVAKDLERDYPERFMVLKYKDVVTRSGTSTEFLHFLNMGADALGNVMNVSQLTKWKTALERNLDLVRDIRGACTKAMDVWGYEPIGTLPA